MIGDDKWKDAEKKAVLQWLSPEAQSVTHHSIRSQRQEDTGMWFIDDILGTGWLGKASSPPILWCRGIRRSYYRDDFGVFF